MSNDDPTTKAGFVARCRKAFIAGVAAAISVAGTAAAGILADGRIEAPELWAGAGAVVAAAAVAFAAVWRVPNASS